MLYTKSLLKKCTKLSLELKINKFLKLAGQAGLLSSVQNTPEGLSSYNEVHYYNFELLNTLKRVLKVVLIMVILIIYLLLYNICHFV